MWPGGKRFLVVAESYSRGRFFIDDYGLDPRECLIVTNGTFEPKHLAGRHFYESQVLWETSLWNLNAALRHELNWCILKEDPMAKPLTTQEILSENHAKVWMEEIKKAVMPDDWSVHIEYSHSVYGFKLHALCPHGFASVAVYPKEKLLGSKEEAEDLLHRIYKAWSQPCGVHSADYQKKVDEALKQSLANLHPSGISDLLSQSETMVAKPFDKEEFDKIIAKIKAAPPKPDKPIYLHPSQADTFKQHYLGDWASSSSSGFDEFNFEPGGNFNPADHPVPNPPPKKFPTVSGATVVDQLAVLFPALLEHYARCPEKHCAKDGKAATLKEQIIHLNDHHKYTRERIADWLDSLDVDLTLQPTSTGD